MSQEVRLKDLVRINANTLPEWTEPTLRFKYVDIGSVTQGRLMIPEEETTFLSSPSRARRTARPGDTVVSTVRTYLRAVAQVPNTPERLVFSTGFAVLSPTPRLDARFLSYYCMSDPFVDEVVSRSVGVSYPAINASELGDFRLRLPSLDEQRRIADFLDAETARIDRLGELSDQRTKLVLERADAEVEGLICRAQEETNLMEATYSPLGRVPQRWSQVRLRSLPCEVQTGPFGSQLHADDYVSQGWPVVNPANIRGRRIEAAEGLTVNDATRARLRRHMLKKGDVIFGRRGELGRAALVAEPQEGWLCGTGCLRVRFRQPVFNPSYLSHFLGISALRFYFQSQSVGSTMDNLNSEILLNMPLFVPPLSEQGRLAEACDEALSAADSVAIRLQRQCDLYVERRSAVITAAVQGRLDVTTAGRAA